MGAAAGPCVSKSRRLARLSILNSDSIGKRCMRSRSPRRISRRREACSSKSTNDRIVCRNGETPRRPGGTRAAKDGAMDEDSIPPDRSKQPLEGRSFFASAPNPTARFLWGGERGTDGVCVQAMDRSGRFRWRAVAGRVRIKGEGEGGGGRKECGWCCASRRRIGGRFFQKELLWSAVPPSPFPYTLRSEKFESPRLRGGSTVRCDQLVRCARESSAAQKGTEAGAAPAGHRRRDLSRREADGVAANCRVEDKVAARLSICEVFVGTNRGIVRGLVRENQ